LLDYSQLYVVIYNPLEQLNPVVVEIESVHLL
jgi:hypothetical protein